MANKLAESKMGKTKLKGPGDGKPQIAKSDTTKPKMMGSGIRMISEKDAIKKFGQNKVDSLNKAYDEEIRKFFPKKDTSKIFNNTAIQFMGGKQKMK